MTTLLLKKVRLSSEVVQAALDEIVWYHGSEPKDWPAHLFCDLLGQGILLEQITQERLTIAFTNKNKELERRLANHEHLGSRLHADYRPTEDKKQEVINRLQRWKETRQQSTSCYNKSNEAVIPNHPHRRSTMTALQVKESELRRALVALGFKSAENPDKWDIKRLNQKVSNYDTFSELIEKSTREPRDTDQEFIESISFALVQGTEVTVVADEEEAAPTGHESNGHSETQEPLVETPVEQSEEQAPKKKSKKKSKKKETAMSTATMEKKPAKKSTKAPEKKGKREGMSLKNAAAQVLKGKVKGMKIDEIYNKILEKGLWTPKDGSTPKATLASSLYTDIKKNGAESRFVQVDKGVFALNS